jgi:hypothetical protein
MEALDWFLDERAAGRPVSNLDIKEKAKQKAEEANLHDFAASDGWIRRWKKKILLESDRE